MTEARYLAVYGSLRRGEAAHEDFGLATKLRFVGPCKLRGLLFDLGDYPALVPGDGVVIGELYEIRDEETWALLDRYEEVDRNHPEEGLFVRREVELIEPRMRAQTYLYGDRGAEMLAVARRILSGDWKRRGLSRPPGG